MRREYEMTEAQLDRLYKASEIHQAALTDAWRALGRELGFKAMTMKPMLKGNRFFTAETSGEGTLDRREK